MKVACLADIHLGYRAYPATIEGRNAREVDIEKAFTDAVQQVVKTDPDLVTFAGDIFHHPRVSNHAKLAFTQGIEHILEATSAHVVAVQGNHDTARTAAVLSPIYFAGRGPRVHVCDEYRVFDANGIKVTAIPACGCPTRRVLLERSEVCVIHAPIKGKGIPSFYAGDDALKAGSLSEIFGVVHAGDYHEPRYILPNVFYSGATAKTTSNIWGEKDSKRGWVFAELKEDGWGLNHVKVYGRPILDLQEEGARGVNTALERVLSSQASYSHLNDRIGQSLPKRYIVRVRADNVSREDVDWKLVKKVKKEVLHLQLEIALPVAKDGIDIATPQPLSEHAEQYFQGLRPLVNHYARKWADPHYKGFTPTRERMEVV